MNVLLFVLGVALISYGLTAILAVLYVQRVTWTQSLVWPYYFFSDVFGKGFEKRPL